ncbi:MAG: sugar transferase [Clostridia bacterium]|nr:sugar transferase [Clostridia bacterium]
MVKSGIIKKVIRFILVRGGKVEVRTGENILLEDNIILTNRNLKINQSNIYNKYIKRIFDVAISIIGLIISLPLFLIIGILIKIESKGPVFFIHERVGKNGKVIKIYKFRTMVKDAKNLIEEFSLEQKKEFEKNFKLEDDPRVTKIGKALRKTSIDELPQLLNILKGELSLIGPRPIVEEELEKYKKHKDKFLSIKPGLTGNWAANGRSCTSYEERINMELYYIQNVSFKLDLEIFWRTVCSVIKRRGAI